MSPKEADMAEETNRSSHYPCACPHGCTVPSTLPRLNSAALARHARCAGCATDEHLAQWPTLGSGARANRAVTDVYQPSRGEKQAAIAAQREVFTEIWSEQWRRWQESLPEKFKHAETNHPHVRERLRRLRAGERGVASMLVVGKPGMGKTFLAVAYANAAIKAGFFKPSEVLFGSEAELLASVANSSFGEVEVGLRRLISKRVKLLVIDDVGRGTWLNETMRPKVFSLVLDKFWSENRVVVLTSNLSPADLGTYVGDGAMDRLRSLVGNGSLVLDEEKSKRRSITDEMLERAAAVAEEEPPVPPAPRNITG
jgi:DNA replication protein DnaC